MKLVVGVLLVSLLATGQFIFRLGKGVTCTGSTMAAGSTPGQVNTRVSSEVDGAVICFATGSFTWGGAGGRIILPLTKGITFACVVQTACEVSWSGFVFDWPDTGNSDKLYRITGFKFTESSGSGGSIMYDAASGPDDSLTSKYRLDHNTFVWTGSSTPGLFTLSTGPTHAHVIYGVVDHNTFSYTTAKTAITFIMGTMYDSALTSWGGSIGDSKNLFFEDNSFESTVTNMAASDCTDAFGIQGVVVRFNTSINCRYVFHGTANLSGPSNIEMYGNDMTFDDNYFTTPNGYAALHQQGSGSGGVWGNLLTDNGGDPATNDIIHIQQYTSFTPNGAPLCDGTRSIDGNRSPTATYRGYPCFHQPGRLYTPNPGPPTEADFRNAFYPQFSFLNQWSTGTLENMILRGGGGASPDYSASTMVQNRDWYNAVSVNAQTSPTNPFNGTVGIGHGTLANRPTTCSVGPDSDVGEPDEGRSGVMYWATDQGSWNTSTSNPYGVQRNGADGVLYMCTATNTWSVYYTPYTYPHPLNTP